MKNYKQLILKDGKIKYHKSGLKNKYFLNSYLLHRKNILKSNSLGKNFFSPKNDKTFNLLKKHYYNYNTNSNILTLKFYQKFEIYNKLKIKYSYYRKISNIETNYNSYIYLGLLVNRNNSLNNIQKYNVILKCVDRSTLLNDIQYLTEDLKKLIQIEIKLFNFLSNE